MSYEDRLIVAIVILSITTFIFAAAWGSWESWWGNTCTRLRYSQEYWILHANKQTGKAYYSFWDQEVVRVGQIIPPQGGSGTAPKKDS